MWREKRKMNFPAQKDHFISRFLIDKSENILAEVCIKCEKGIGSVFCQKILCIILRADDRIHVKMKSTEILLKNIP